jgi:hypothetical protein
MSKSDHKDLIIEKKVYFFSICLCQDPGLLGYGFKVVDRTIDV